MQKFEDMKTQELLNYVFGENHNNRFIWKIGKDGIESILDSELHTELTPQILVERAVTIRAGEICQTEIEKLEDQLPTTEGDEYEKLLQKIEAYNQIVDEMNRETEKMIAAYETK